METPINVVAHRAHTHTPTTDFALAGPTQGPLPMPVPVRLVFDENDESNISQPPPTSHGRSHQRSQTITTLPPSHARSQSTSPIRNSAFLPFHKTSRPTSPARSGSESASVESTERDAFAKARPGAVGKLSSWFEGSSAPVNISFVPSDKRPQQEPFYQVNATTCTAMPASADNLTERSTRRHAVSPTTANSSMFSFFKRSVVPTATKPDAGQILRTDIVEALFPEGPVQEFSADNFKALQKNAESLVRRFQQSHAENLGALRQLASEKAVQSDELEATQTRNEHLKLQLLEMAERSAEQERHIANLKDQLNKHQQSIRMIAEDEPNLPPMPYRKHRHSDYSTYADSMTDSDLSSAVSVFSEVESIHTPATSVAPSPVMKHARLHNPTIIVNPAARSHTTPVLVTDCSNCHGVPAAEAWDVIGIMKAESMGLKQRVIELETAQDDALDFLSGLRL